MSDPKYGPETRAFLAATGADAVFTMVFGGVRGDGMAAAARVGQVNPHMMSALLRRLADDFDKATPAGESFDVVRTPF